MARELHCVMDGLDPLDPNSNPTERFTAAGGGNRWVNFTDLPMFFERLNETYNAAIAHQNDNQDEEDYQEWQTLATGSSGCDYWHEDHGLPDLYRVLVPRGTFSGYRYFAGCRDFHHPSQQQDPVQDIVARLTNGELCIVTSFGIPEKVMKAFSHRLVGGIIDNAKRAFSQSLQPPLVQSLLMKHTISLERRA